MHEIFYQTTHFTKIALFCTKYCIQKYISVTLCTKNCINEHVSANVCNVKKMYQRAYLNTTISSKMQAEQSILNRIQRELKWHGHLLRMKDNRWPKKIYQWTPHGRRRRWRPQQSWRNQVTDFMRSRNMEEDMAEDRNLGSLGVDGRLLTL